jgi:hypothetical protein
LGNISFGHIVIEYTVNRIIDLGKIISIKFILLSFFLLVQLPGTFAQSGLGQDTAMVKRFMDEAISDMQRGNYVGADLLFRKILSMEVIIPDEFCFYYGETLFELRKYRLSKTFLDKYQELTDGAGTFSEETSTALAEVNKKISAIKKCADCDDDGFLVTLEDCHFCGGDGKISAPCSRCGGSGVEICPTCLGEGVEVLRTSFGRRYITCTTCNGIGSITCQKCLGTKIEYHLCDACGGTGKLEMRKRIID